MDPGASRLVARIGAIEFLIENVYATALMQTVDPVGEARRWAHELTALTRVARTSLDGAASADAVALVTDMADELDAIFARIVARVEKQACDWHTRGSA